MEKKSKKTVAKQGRDQTFDGKEGRPEPIPYSWEWDVYTSVEELVAAKDEMSLKDQLKFRNAEAQRKARQASLNKAMDEAGVEKKTSENDDQVRLKEMLKTLLTAKLKDGTPKYTEEQAKEVAATACGCEWEDED